MRPGGLRWSLPLPGRLILDSEVSGSSPDGDAPLAAFARGLLVYQLSGIVWGIDSASGQVRWRRDLGRALTSATAPEQAPEPLITGDAVAIVAQYGASLKAARSLWILNATAGAVDAKLALPLAWGDVIPLFVTGSNAVIYAGGGVRALGARGTLWSRSLPLAQGLAVIDNVLYSNQTRKTGGGDRIARIDLRTGARMSDLPVPADMTQASGDGVVGDTSGGFALIGPTQGSRDMAPVTGSDSDAAALLYETEGQLARLNPRTGAVMWMGAAASTFSQADLAGSPPTIVTEPQLGHMSGLDLRTGRVAWTSRLSLRKPDSPLHFAYDGLAINLADPGFTGPGGAALARVNAVQPVTGRTRWQGPLMSQASTILGGPADGPRVIVTVACAPAGVQAATASGGDATCTRPRMFALIA